jgi:hypothetical protein
LDIRNGECSNQRRKKKKSCTRSFHEGGTHTDQFITEHNKVLEKRPRARARQSSCLAVGVGFKNIAIDLEYPVLSIVGLVRMSRCAMRGLARKGSVLGKKEQSGKGGVVNDDWG